ncbi:MAG: hypothetical protein P4L67_04755 [Candidatus Pacebacteria bacterium]|nr:hypothetical protein [Candidatus Paceibacterota bacterium]
MEPKKAKTLSDAVEQHQSMMQYGDYLVQEQAKCLRNEASAYNQIKEILLRSEYAGAAMVDEKLKRVYFLGDSGVVASLSLVWAESVSLDQEVDLDEHSNAIAISLGEIS